MSITVGHLWTLPAIRAWSRPPDRMYIQTIIGSHVVALPWHHTVAGGRPKCPAAPQHPPSLGRTCRHRCLLRLTRPGTARTAPAWALSAAHRVHPPAQRLDIKECRAALRHSSQLPTEARALALTAARPQCTISGREARTPKAVAQVSQETQPTCSDHELTNIGIWVSQTRGQQEVQCRLHLQTGPNRRPS